MKSIYRFGLIVTVMLAVPCAAFAQGDLAMLDTIGFMFESDNTPGVQGFPPSVAGDVLAGVGFIDGVSDPTLWGVDFATYEYTWVISNLVASTPINIGGGSVRIFYTGGTLDVIADELLLPGDTMPDYGTDPPLNGPIGFGDGHVYLHGVFTNFAMDYNADSMTGSFQGQLQFELGGHFQPFGYEQLEHPEGYTLAGVVGPATTIIPEGYDLEADGHIWFNPAIPDADSSWGSVKNLYR